MIHDARARRGRVFICWHSKLAALALSALAVTWGGEALAGILQRLS